MCIVFSRFVALLDGQQSIRMHVRPDTATARRAERAVPDAAAAAYTDATDATAAGDASADADATAEPDEHVERELG